MTAENQDIIESVKKYIEILEDVKSVPKFVHKLFHDKGFNSIVESFVIGEIKEWRPEGHLPGWVLYPEGDKVYTHTGHVLPGCIELVSPEDVATQSDGKLMIPDFKVGDIVLVLRNKSFSRIHIDFFRK